MTRAQISLRNARVMFGWLKYQLVSVVAVLLACSTLFSEGTKIPEVAANTAVVITNSLNVRSDPGLYSPAVTTLKYGDIVEVLSREYKWSKIQSEDGEGWVYSSYLKFDCRGWAAVVTLNVREESSLQSAIIFRLSRGDPVRILDAQGEWYYITAGGEYGWVYKSLVSMSPVIPTDKTEQRRQNYLARNPALPNIFKRAIEEGTFFIGMSRDQVEASLGEPQEIIEKAGLPVQEEQWIYNFNRITMGDITVSSTAQSLYLNFQSGYLTSWGVDFSDENP